MLQGAEGSSEKRAVVRLPNTFTRDTMYGLLEGLFDDNHDLLSREMTLDFSRLKRIQVGGVAALSNIIEAVRKCGGHVEMEGIAESPAKPFLTGSGFLSEYLTGGGRFASPGAEFAPLKLVQYSGSYIYIGEEFIPWLAGALAVTSRSLASVKVTLEEAFNNINDHSMVQIGCCCGHFDRTARKITICISDFGVGIPENVRKKEPLLDDARAIQQACQQGFTTKSRDTNMGAGLPHLVRNIVSLHGGVVNIHSGRGSYSCVRDGSGGVKDTPKRAPAFYPGTMLRLTLDIAKMSVSNDEEEFEWSPSES